LSQSNEKVNQVQGDLIRGSFIPQKNNSLGIDCMLSYDCFHWILEYGGWCLLAIYYCGSWKSCLYFAVALSKQFWAPPLINNRSIKGHHSTVLDWWSWVRFSTFPGFILDIAEIYRQRALLVTSL